MSKKDTAKPQPQPQPPPNVHNPATCPCATCASLRRMEPGYWDDYIRWERDNPSSPGGGPGA